MDSGDDGLLEAFRYNPKVMRVMVLGREHANFSKRLEKLGYIVCYVKEEQAALEQLSTGNFQMVFLQQPSASESSIIPSIKEIDDNISIIIILKEGEEIDTNLRGQVVDYIEETLPLAILNTRTEAFLKNKLMKSHLKKLLAARQEVLQQADEVYHKLLDQEEKLGTVIESVEQLEKEKSEIIDRNKELQDKMLKLESEQKQRQQNIQVLMEQITTLRSSVNSLQSEQEKRSDLEKILSDKDKELEAMKKKIAEAFESPIQKLTRDVAKLSRADYQTLDKEEIKQTLGELIKSLGNSELYRPTFQKLFKVVDLDEMTRKWMVSQFCQEKDMVQDQKESETVQTKKTETVSRGQATQNSSINDITSFIADRSATITPEQFEKMKTFEFEVWTFSKEQLPVLWEFMFQDLGFIEQFKINRDTLRKFLGKVISLYKDNFYHNVFHAFDVTQTIYCFFKTGEVDKFLPALDRFTLFVSALCHDLDHPGVSNQFQINSQSDLALTYNDRSVLENHHAYLTANMLQNPEFNIAANLEPQELKQFRRVMIASILATDMSCHFELVSKFTTHIETTNFKIDDPKDRELICNILLHSADISNAAKKWPISKRWSDLVFDEFLVQGDQEKKLGIPVSPFMDRNNTDEAKLNTNFATFMVKPLFVALAKFIPVLSPLVDNMAENATKWQEIMQQKK
eukprot:TRINITY_DN982_c0_g1_i1.p1 TRINITY_DN982_c0_g1~~TRINITY_DN982_c0_g1_i1.p1  ORF type:complete len:695 (-),score=239.68 TRINITY_DN982_c0_g1_i1:155-2209(-)